MTKSDCNPLIPRGESGAFNCVRAMNHGSFFDTGNGYAGFFNGSDGNREPFDWWNFFRYGRACSRDGVHWEVAAADLPFSSPTAIQFHPDEPEASRRYKGVHFAIAGERETMARNGQPELCGRSTPGWLYTSADGIHFSVTDATISWPEEYMFLEHCPMNITCDPLDPDGKYYRAYGYASLSLGRRAATVAWSRDLTEWRVEPVIALTTERAAYPYISCGAAAQIHGMIVRKLQGDYIALVHNQENHDHTNITCAYSRDGIHFEPVCPGQKLLDNGAAGAWDCDHMAPLNFHCGVDAWQIYYSGMRLADNSASLGLATIVPDGIVMLRFSDHEAPAELETLDFRIDERCELAVEIDADEVDPRITCIHCHDGTVREGGRLILKPGEYRLRFTFTARDAAAAIRKIRICNHAL